MNRTIAVNSINPSDHRIIEMITVIMYAQKAAMIAPAIARKGAAVAKDPPSEVAARFPSHFLTLRLAALFALDDN